jgi:uncharacterized lipoprotein YmbA
MRSRRTRSLGEIAHIRALQQQSEEIRLSRANLVQDEKLELHQEEQRLQDAREQSWAQTLAGRFDLALSRAWSQAVTDGAGQLASTAAAVTVARLETSAAGEALQGARARAEAAEALETRARRRERRAEESRSLHEIADLHSARGVHED